MQAAVFHGTGHPLRIESVADPIPSPGAVVVEVAACGICGSDLHWSAMPGEANEGTVFGHEFSGTVVAAEADHADLVGRRVTAVPLFSCWDCEDCRAGLPVSCNSARLIGLDRPGAFAQRVAVDARMLHALPDGVSFDQGALAEPLAVARHAVAKAGDLAGRDVLVMGAGPIGAAATLLVAAQKPRNLVVSEPAEPRRVQALRLGAGAVIDPADGVLVPAFRRIAGKRPDVVVVCVGIPGAIQQAIDAVDKRGTVIVAGMCTEPDTIVPVGALVKNVTVAFSGGYQPADFNAVIAAMASGELPALNLVTGSVTLDELPSTLESLRTPGDHCKVLVHPSAG